MSVKTQSHVLTLNFSYLGFLIAHDEVPYLTWL